jgi:hypothetical protein
VTPPAGRPQDGAHDVEHRLSRHLDRADIDPPNQARRTTMRRPGVLASAGRATGGSRTRRSVVVESVPPEGPARGEHARYRAGTTPNSRHGAPRGNGPSALSDNAADAKLGSASDTTARWRYSMAPRCRSGRAEFASSTSFGRVIRCGPASSRLAMSTPFPLHGLAEAQMRERLRSRAAAAATRDAITRITGDSGHSSLALLAAIIGCPVPRVPCG